MKILKNLFSVCFLMLSYLCVSCEVEYMDFNAPTVDISQMESENADELSILITPSSGTATYRYALSATSDFSTFSDGTMAGIETVQGEEAKVAVFTGLEPGTTYYVFAQAYNAENISGGLATKKITFIDKNEISVSLEYNLSKSATFKICYPSRYVQCRYLLGRAEDRNAFINNQATGTKVLNELPDGYKFINYFELEPETDYVFYAQATDIIGAATDLFEIPFTTPAKDKAAYAEFEIVEEDVYRQHYRLTPNSECGKIICVFNEMGMGAESLIDGLGWYGDWVKLIEGWSKVNSKNPNLWTYKAEGGKPVEIIFNDNTFAFSTLKSMEALLYDKTGTKPVGIQYFTFAKADQPKEAGAAKVSIEVKEINQQGATYIYKTNDNTLGYYFDTVDADWWDKNKDQLLAQDPYYLQNLLHVDHIFNYAKDFGNGFEFFEINAEPGHRYYALACPMNAKGPGAGWGEVTMVEYTTLSE